MIDSLPVMQWTKEYVDGGFIEEVLNVTVEFFATVVIATEGLLNNETMVAFAVDASVYPWVEEIEITMNAFTHGAEDRWRDGKIEYTVLLTDIFTAVILIKDALIGLHRIKEVIQLGEIFITIVLTTVIMTNCKEWLNTLRISF